MYAFGDESFTGLWNKGFCVSTQSVYISLIPVSQKRTVTGALADPSDAILTFLKDCVCTGSGLEKSPARLPFTQTLKSNVFSLSSLRSLVRGANQTRRKKDWKAAQTALEVVALSQLSRYGLPGRLRQDNWGPGAAYCGRGGL